MAEIETQLLLISVLCDRIALKWLHKRLLLLLLLLLRLIIPLVVLQ